MTEQERERIAKEVCRIDITANEPYLAIADYVLAKIEKAKKDARVEVAERIRGIIGGLVRELGLRKASPERVEIGILVVNLCDKIIKENEG